MCTYLNVRFVMFFFFFAFFVPLGTLRLIIGRHFPRQCGNAAIPRSGKNTTSVTVCINTGKTMR